MKFVSKIVQVFRLEHVKISQYFLHQIAAYLCLHQNVAKTQFRIIENVTKMNLPVHWHPLKKFVGKNHRSYSYFQDTFGLQEAD